MSVLVSKRAKSKLEVFVCANDIHKMLIELIQRDLGVRDVDQVVRIRYAYGKDPVENFPKYRELMRKSKDRIDETAALLTTNLRIANSIYPTSMHEYEQRRDYQNYAIANCETLIKELQHVVEIFEVDINLYSRHITAINREIGLIKSWRQRDNKLKARLRGSI